MTGDGSESAKDPSLEVGSALVRSESSDLDAMLHALVERLSGVPGLNIVVRYRHGRLRRLIGDIPYVNDLHRQSDPIESVVVTVDRCAYWLRSDDGLVSCGTDTVTIDSGKVSDTLPLSEWADRLFADIAGQNHINLESLTALRGLIEDDRA